MVSTMKSLLAAKKAIEEEKKENKIGGIESGMAGSVPDNAEAEAPKDGETVPVEKPLVTEGDVRAAQEVAMFAGADYVPGGEDAVGTTNLHAILKQTKNPSEEEVQTRRTEVDTHVTILPSDPDGANVHAADPPRGTLPNSGIILEDDGIMGVREKSLREGLSMNAISDEENQKAIKAYEGEQRRQRMLEGRPRDTDMAADQEDAGAPEGGYKSNGILRFVNALGNWVLAVNGYFVPANEEEKKILDHYVTTGVVEAPGK